MSMMKQVLFSIVEDYSTGKSAVYIMDKLMDEYGFNYDQALEIYEQAIMFASKVK